MTVIFLPKQLILLLVIEMGKIEKSWAAENREPQKYNLRHIIL